MHYERKIIIIVNMILFAYRPDILINHDKDKKLYESQIISNDKSFVIVHQLLFHLKPMLNF
jgi:hypothetical protein